MACVLVIIDGSAAATAPPASLLACFRLARQVASLAGAACFAAICLDADDELGDDFAERLGRHGVDRAVVVVEADVVSGAERVIVALGPLLTLVPDDDAGRALIPQLATAGREAGPALRLHIPPRPPARARPRRRDETTRVDAGTGARLVPVGPDTRRWPLEVLARPLIAATAAEGGDPAVGARPATVTRLGRSAPTVPG